jgi:pyocin large subunit-like protein
VPLLTNGFRSNQQRLQHFCTHGADFGATYDLHYQNLADAFIGGRPPKYTLQSKRPRDNDLIRYNPVTNEFAILSYDGYIRTYFKPDIGDHQLPRNLDYYFANGIMFV